MFFYRSNSEVLWGMGQCVRIVIFACMMLFPMSGAAFAKGPEQKEPICKDKFSSVGMTSTLEMVATLSSIIKWLKTAQKHGDTYASWHRAKSKEISCNKRGILYICYVSAIPCLDESIASDNAKAKKQDTFAAK